MTLFGALINMTDFVPLAVFGLIAVIVWIVLTQLLGRNSRVESRLDDVKDPMRRRAQSESALLKRPDSMQAVLERAAPALSRPLQPKSELEQSQLRIRLSNAGWRSESAVSIFLGAKFLALLVGLGIGASTMIAAYGTTQKAIMLTVLFGGIGFYLPELVLYVKKKGRQDAIFLSLPDALDLLVVCVEAGLGLDAGMRRVSDEMRLSSPVISEELAMANFQLQMGRPRREVLHELGVRTGVDDVRSLAAILIQADRFGSSVAQALRVQSDSMRTRRRQLAEERAAKTAVKLIFPLVLFIFPGIFVVLVGPAAITMVRDLFPQMTGG